MSEIEKRLAALNLELPPAPPAGGVYHPVLIIDKMLYVSGQGPSRKDGSLVKGKLGMDLNVEEGYLTARQVGLTMLSTIREHADLSSIHRLVKTFGMVNSVSSFHDQPAVINGFSDLMVELWGEDLGKGVRSAVGMMLPGNIAVEIEAVFQLK
ncbi:RidA family protein [Fulvivirga sedimenti]|jgi:enamine deaminase RidA (YjgF/YER057c/UK114 family)|uniref:RidA family protein n=1 Tax=Fulvivirga sedimenti TaxID=2879465 RepID=A0A9X1HLW9_9BACT|nr:RidA family protein [Fulvivirga sedimenti]MCA6073238.1 RidA family protein [Fulvivirga sedimenti]